MSASVKWGKYNLPCRVASEIKGHRKHVLFCGKVFCLASQTPSRGWGKPQLRTQGGRQSPPSNKEAGRAGVYLSWPHLQLQAGTGRGAAYLAQLPQALNHNLVSWTQCSVTGPLRLEEPTCFCCTSMVYLRQVRRGGNSRQSSSGLL